MTNHPMTPSPSQLDQWEMVAGATTDPSLLNEPAIRAGHFGVVHRKALRLAFAAGADQELEACVAWFQEFYKTESWVKHDLKHFRAARRPKPLSLKEQALAELAATERCHPADYSTIRRALEALPND